MDGLASFGDFVLTPLIEGNRDGFVSSEETFDYAKRFDPSPWGDPQINDQYNGEGGFPVTYVDRYNEHADQYQCRIFWCPNPEIQDGQWLAQSFKPTCDKLTRISLYVTPSSDVDSPLIVSIRRQRTGSICLDQ